MVTNSISADSNQHGGPTRMHSSSDAYETLIESNKRAIDRFNAVIRRLEDEEEKASNEISDFDELLKRLEDLSEKRKTLRSKILEYQKENEEYMLQLDKFNKTKEIIEKETIQPSAGYGSNLDYEEGSDNARKQEGTTLQNTHQVHQDTSVKTGGTKTVSDFFKGNKKYNLIAQYDSKGKYYEFTTLEGKTEKFYLEGEDVKLDYKLRSLKDFPMWSVALSGFCDQFNMDDITNTNLDFSKTPAQCEILRKVIGDSLANKFRDYLTMRLDGQALYKKIREEVRESYTHRVKDSLWDEIVVDAYCSDLRHLSTTYSDMISLEIYTENKDSDRLKNEAIGRKIRSTLSSNLRMQVDSKYERKYGTDLEDNINPKDYIDTIFQVIKYRKDIAGVYNESIKECFRCNSTFHRAENCKNWKRRDPQDQAEKSTVNASSHYVEERQKLQEKGTEKHQKNVEGKHY